MGDPQGRARALAAAGADRLGEAELVAPVDRTATGAAVDTGMLHGERAEEFVEHLTQVNDDRPSNNPAGTGFTDVLLEPEFAAGDDDGRAADLDFLDPLGRALRPRIERRRAADFGAL